MQWLPILLAGYGAVLSTVVAIIQIRKYVSDNKFLTVRITRAFGEGGETVDFRIANSGSSMTQINEVTFLSNELTDTGHIITANGNSAPLFTRSMWDDQDKEIELPTKLLPGDVIFARMEPDWYVCLMKGDVVPRDKYVNLFTIEIDHSRGMEALQKYFSLSNNGPFCKSSNLMAVRQLDLFRSRIWNYDKGVD
mgnify:CR=1 FL=1